MTFVGLCAFRRLVRHTYLLKIAISGTINWLFLLINKHFDYNKYRIFISSYDCRNFKYFTVSLFTIILITKLMSPSKVNRFAMHIGLVMPSMSEP